uniref:Uncharacterized protein n=1 Tax=Glossina palpalis gambiensis TaxID=67801 RepID=A0A1B0APP6_9MUSC
MIILSLSGKEIEKVLLIIKVADIQGLNFGFLNANFGRVCTVDENVDKLLVVATSELVFVEFSSVSNACIESSEFVSARYSFSSALIFLAVQEASKNFTLNE